ncbi:hypothetical protein [Halpernia sp. GG3]
MFNETAELRIPILQKNIAEIKIFTATAKINDLKINISSEIKINLDENN